MTAHTGYSKGAERGRSMAVLDLIDTIVVVIMENRSFDHMLGYLSHPDFGKRPDVNGQRAEQRWLDCFTNEWNGKRQAPFHATPRDMADDPRHERENFCLQFGADFKPGAPYPMNGFMRNYAQGPVLSPDELTQVMGFFTPAEIPITAFLA